MTLKNRTEVAAAIQSQSAIVGETEYKGLLDDDFAQSVVFRKDVSDSDTAPGGTKTLDFLDIDYIEIAQSTSVTYTLNNVQQGEIKFLKITKSAGQTINFAVATDVSARKDYIDLTVTAVIYKITNKDSNLYVESINIDVVSESKIVEIGDWNMSSSSNVIVGIGTGVGSKVRAIDVIIRNDANSGFYKLSIYDGSNIAGSVGAITANSVTLNRFSPGFFASVDFDSTSYNRGWIYIEYEP